MEFSLLNFLLVLLVAMLAGMVARRIGYPAVLGELLAGILLGPPLLGVLAADEALGVLAEVGILLMMLYIGMEIDPIELGRASKAGLLAAAGGFITPFVLCYLLIIGVGGTAMAALFVGVAAGITSLATKSRVLLDLKLLDTRIAHVMMAGALVTDTVSLILFAAVVGIVEVGSLDVGTLALLAGKAVLFFGGTALIGLKGFPLLGRQVEKLQAFGRVTSFTLVLVLMLLFAELAELAGLHSILGAFLAGLYLRESTLGQTLSREIMEMVHHASIGFLAPVFFVTAGFAVSLNVLSESLGLLALLIVVATVGKIVGTTLFYLPTGYGWREGVTVGLGMNGRGAVEIIIAQIALTMGLITQNIFSLLVFMAIFTTALEPALLKWGIAWLRRRGELVQHGGRRKGTLVVGAGAVARALGKVLARSEPVWVVDRNREHCDLAAAEGLTTVSGNALDERVLSEANAAHVQRFIAITPNAEVNTLAAQLARKVFLVPEVHVLSSGDSAGHSALLEHVQATTLFGGAVSLPEWNFHVTQSHVRRQGVTLARPLSAPHLFRELQRTRNSLPLALRRGDHYLPFHSESKVEEGDRLIVLQVEASPLVSFDRFDRLALACAVLDIERAVSMDAFFDLAAAALADRLAVEPGHLAQQFTEREAASSTILLPGLAVPHLVIEGSGRFEMLIARCRDGIRFPHQQERVHAAFVLVGTRDERTFHLRALSAIAQIVQGAEFEQAWLAAGDAEALRRLVVTAVRRRLPAQGSEEVPSEPA